MKIMKWKQDLPKFSEEAFISAIVRIPRPRVDAVGGFELPAGECSD